MPHYRVTIRYGEPRRQYHVQDVEASDLADALRRTAESFPEEAERTGDLVEVRRQAEPESREYAPG